MQNKTVFNAAAPAHTVPGYNPDWASYGQEYGQSLKPGDDFFFIAGFYKVAERDGKIYAAFGGAFGPTGTVKGATPGYLVILAADTLQLERAIALPGHANALELMPNRQTAIVTYTRGNALSIVDLESGELRSLKPDTGLGDVDEYQGRYVVADEHGHFFINYHGHARQGLQPSSVVMKYDADGVHVPDFGVHVTENHMVIPLLYRDGQLLTGSKGLKAVDAVSGAVVGLTTESESSNIYNYAAGPGDSLLASDYNQEGRPNLLLIDPAHNGFNAIYTGQGSVDVAYVAESGLAFSTNYDSNTITVAAVSTDSNAWRPGHFVSILLDGAPATLHARYTPEATELFVAVKYWGEQNLRKGARLHKIRIENTFKTVHDIAHEGVCTLQVFDMADKSVSAPKACTVLDAKASYQSDAAQMAVRIDYLLQRRQELESAIAQARKQAEADSSGLAHDAQDSFADLQAQLGVVRASLEKTLAGREVLRHLAGASEHG